MVRSERVIWTVDFHTGGQGMRLLSGGLGKVPGSTMLEKRRHFEQHLDHIRTGLCMEPRGHRDMLMAVMTDPVSDEADFGLLFMDPSAYLDSCGEATIGAATVAIETGLVPASGPRSRVVIDTVAGTVQTLAHVEDGRVREVTMSMRPSFVVAADQAIKVQGLGEVPIDVVVGAGNVFCIVEAEAIGVELQRERIKEILQKGVVIRDAVNDQLQVDVPRMDHVSVGLVEIVEPPAEDGVFRNAVIWGAGAVDRAPCGTGTCARLALLHYRSELDVGQSIIHEGVLGTRFRGLIADASQTETGPTVHPEIGGTAYITCLAQFLFDPQDPLREGYLLDL
jgi:proline racemase